MSKRCLIPFALVILLLFGCGKKEREEVRTPPPAEAETAPAEAPSEREAASVERESPKPEQAPAEQAAPSAEAAPKRETAKTKAQAKKPVVSRQTAQKARAQEKKPAAEKAAAKDVREAKAADDEGVVTFLSGKVSVDRGAGWSALDVEDPVRTDDRVKTGSDSFCEIQFSNFGIIRVQDNSEVLLRQVLLKEGTSRVDVKLDGGNMLCKVSKLGKGERFDVRTNTALAGVRGTEFLVREASGGTVVAVNEGRVSVIPSAIVERIETLKSELRTETAKSVLDEIALPEIILTDRKEVAIERARMETAVRTFEEVSPALEQKIREIDRKAAMISDRELSARERSADREAGEPAEVRKERESIEALKESVLAQVEKKSEEIRQTLDRPESVSKTSLKELQEIKRMKPRELVVASKAEPESGAGERERKPGREEAPARPAYAKVTIEVYPRDAEIFVNDENVGRARYSGLYPPGTVLVIRAVREGYKTHVYKYTVNEREKRQELSIELRSPVSWQLKGSGFPYVRKGASAGAAAVFADRRGRLVCVSFDGKALWNYATKNDPNENSMPVVAGDNVMFSGTAELVVVSLKSGELLKSIPLGGERYSSHLFGRRVVPRDGTLLFPSDGAILLLDGNTLQETRAIRLPGESQCSPAVYGDRIVIADQMGDLLLIDSETGAVEQRVETDAFRPASVAPTVIGTKAVFADTRGSVAAVDLEKRTLLWQRNLGGKGVFADIEYDEGRLYVYNGEEFYTLSLDDGRDLFSPVRSSCLPYAGGRRLYYGDMDGRFLVVDALTGNILRSTVLASPVSAQPLPAGEGVLVGTAAGVISMIKLEDL